MAMVNPGAIIRFIKDYQLVNRSGYFEWDFYLKAYPFVAGSGNNPITDYLLRGWKEGRDPGLLFNSREYLDMSPDVREAGLNPLVHYLRFGKQEGRKITRSWVREDGQIPTSKPAESELSDVEWTKLRFHERFNYPLDVKRPQTFNEKLNVYKMYYREKPLWQYVDKYSAKDYVKQKIGAEYLVPSLGAFTEVDDIQLEQLPDQFVLKATHGSGWNIFCRDKSQLDWQKCRDEMRGWLSDNLYLHFREWPYNNITPRILVEPLLQDPSGKLPNDYKFFCYNGEVKYVYEVSERETAYYLDFYDMDWHWLPIRFGYPNNPHKSTKPRQFDEMVRIAGELSRGFPFVRVDLYASPKIYFGELTFYPQAGFIEITPREWDIRLGQDFRMDFLGAQNSASSQ